MGSSGHYTEAFEKEKWLKVLLVVDLRFILMSWGHHWKVESLEDRAQWEVFKSLGDLP